MAALMKYDWPGNIRELQNVIERSVILTNGRELRAPIAELMNPEAPDDNAHQALSIKTLRQTNGLVGGPKGAAARHGLKRTTADPRLRPRAECDPKKVDRSVAQAFEPVRFWAQFQAIGLALGLEIGMKTGLDPCCI